eukprot:359622-Chlamydomonas_euryale.AAC.4
MEPARKKFAKEVGTCAIRSLSLQQPLPEKLESSENKIIPVQQVRRPGWIAGWQEKQTHHVMGGRQTHHVMHASLPCCAQHRLTPRGSAP